METPYVVEIPSSRQLSDAFERQRAMYYVEHGMASGQTYAEAAAEARFLIAKERKLRQWTAEDKFAAACGEMEQL